MQRSKPSVIAVFIVCLLAFTILMLASAVSASGPQNNESQATPHLAQRTLTTPGQIGYLTAPTAGDPLDIALNFIQENGAALGLTPSDLSDLLVTDQYVSEHTGITHIYLRQRYNGIEVEGANLNINITEDGRVLNMANSFVVHLAAGARDLAPTLSAVEAVHAAANHLNLTLTENVTVLASPRGVDQSQLLSDGGISQDAIPARLVYEFHNGQVHIAWDLVIYELGSEHWWSLRVDAQSGAALSLADWVAHDHWGTPEQNSANLVQPGMSGGSNAAAPSALVPESYRVFPIPIESPSHGANALILNPFDMTASPYGWHDTNGVAGPEYTITRGNNAYADTDLDANNIPDGNAPDGGVGLVFDYVFDPSLPPGSYVPFAVTNLFYWNNIMHDVSYLYGFNEPAGNFQAMNYSGTGAGNDHVNADAQDGSGTNNANFATPPDGSSPRMQMYVWTPPLGNIVTVNTPPVIAGDYGASAANFGPPLSTTGPITGDLSLVNDSTGPDVNDGCETFVAFPAGAIALLNRGNCNFTVKVANAQAAGAIAAIIINNVPGTPITMGGTDPTITIPSVMVSQADGQLMQANLPVNATLKDAGGTIPNRDSDLDNGIITHEYGHGISNRLTGGPSAAGCLNNQEQMGEGWSDWQSLFYTSLPSHTPTTPRGVGTYAVFEPTNGTGIRPAPYTTDMGVNPYTYSNIDDGGPVTIPHGLGFIWNSMLWEMYWNLVNLHGYNPNIYEAWNTGGNNLAYQLVMDGLKLQPCSPGFVDGRDAILAADMALTSGANQCAIWSAFAKRGLGFSADQGSSLVVGDETEAFDLPGTCAFLSATPLSQNACAGSSVAYVVDVGPLFTAPPVTLSSSGEPAGTSTTFTPNPVSTVPSTATMTVNTTSGVTPGGTYTLTIMATDVSTMTDSFDVQLTVFAAAPTAPTLISPSDGATNLEFQPDLTWMPVADAVSYEVDIATDAAFTNIIETASVTGTTYGVTSVLNEGTPYYWRVRAVNLCGTTNSAPYSFTTVSAACAPGTFDRTIYLETFDSGAAGWTHQAPIPPDTWTLVNTNPSPGSGGFSYFAEDVGTPAEQHLISPEIVLPTADTQLTLQFLNEQNFEDPLGSGGCWDGGLLEITTDAGVTWTQLDAELLSDPYDGAGDNGPPAGLNLWCGQVAGEQPWLNSIVDLDAYAGAAAQFRFRVLTDASAGAEGWYIDDFMVTSCSLTPTDVTLSAFGSNGPTGLSPIWLVGLVIMVFGAAVWLRRRVVR